MNYQPLYAKSLALLVGINKYRYAPPLGRACEDAASVAEVLIKELGFPKTDVAMLLDEAATRQRIMERFLAYGSLSPDDRLFVFFAGHGETIPGQRGDIGFLVPADGNPNDKSTLIPWRELTGGAELIPAKHVLFVMDACYSGLAIQRGGRAGGQRFVSDMLQRISRQVITAGKADEPVSDGGSATGGNSIFTGHFLEGLRGKAVSETGVLTANDLMHYVYDKVATDPHSHQTPHYGHLYGDGDFILRTPGNVHLSGILKQDFLVETLPERPEQLPIASATEIKPAFAEKNGYGDPESEKFGQNEWSQRLCGWKEGMRSETVPASHWLALVVEPVSNQPLVLDLAKLAKRLPNYYVQTEKPYDQFCFPSRALTTAKSVIFYDVGPSPEGQRPETWKRFVRIEQGGAMEYCESLGAACNYRRRSQENSGTTVRVFLYVQVIGLVWNFLAAAKRVYGQANYAAGVRYLVNLVGAKDTMLVQFSKEPGVDGKSWRQPFDFEAMLDGSLENWRCRDAHFQAEFQIALGSQGEGASKKLIAKCAEQLGLAYNHQSLPRCFNFGTDIFPWESFSRPLG